MLGAKAKPAPRLLVDEGQHGGPDPPISAREGQAERRYLRGVVCDHVEETAYAVAALVQRDDVVYEDPGVLVRRQGRVVELVPDVDAGIVVESIGPLVAVAVPDTLSREVGSTTIAISKRSSKSSPRSGIGSLGRPRRCRTSKAWR